MWTCGAQCVPTGIYESFSRETFLWQSIQVKVLNLVERRKRRSFRKYVPVHRKCTRSYSFNRRLGAKDARTTLRYTYILIRLSTDYIL